MSYTGWHVETLWVRRDAQGAIVGLSERQPIDYTPEQEKRPTDPITEARVAYLKEKGRKQNRRNYEKYRQRIEMLQQLQKSSRKNPNNTA